MKNKKKHKTFMKNKQIENQKLYIIKKKKKGKKEKKIYIKK